MSRKVLFLCLVGIATAVTILRDAPPMQIAGLGALVAATAAVGWAMRFGKLSTAQADLLYVIGLVLNVGGGIALHATFAGGTLLVMLNGVIFLSQLRAGARRDAAAFAAFALFLPRTLAGPVVGYRSFTRRLQAALTAPWDAARAEIGAIYLAVGLAKWLILGHALGRSIAPVFAAADAGAAVGGTDAWLATIANYLQLYFELSGACDAAIGLLLVVGISLPPAFVAPLRASSIASFWRRYHRPLVAVAKVYLQRTFRVGGRVAARVAGLAAFVCAGLWLAPGVGGLVWGVVQAAELLVDRATRRVLKVPRPVGWLVTQFFMAVTALLLHTSSLAAAGRLFEGLIGRAGFALPTAALNFFSPDWQKRLVFTDQPLIAGHTIGLIVLVLLLAIAALAVAVPPLHAASRGWRRTYFAVVIYFVLGLVLQLPSIPVLFAGLRF
jgi:hypothetical protein